MLYIHIHLEEIMLYILHSPSEIMLYISHSPLGDNDVHFTSCNHVLQNLQEDLCKNVYFKYAILYI